MTKTNIIPQKNIYTLSIPNDYIGKKIEILVYALEEIAEESALPTQPKLSDKYRGVISKEQGQSLNEHSEQMRSEWNII